MNILHLISSGGYYGAENVMVSVAEYLENHDCRSTIAVFDHPHRRNDELIQQAERRRLPIVRIACRGRWDREAVRGIREAVQSLTVDVVHSHGYKTDIYSYLAARTLCIPLIATCHNWTHDSAAVRVYEFLDGLVLRTFDAVVVVSERIAADLRSSGIEQSKIHVIDNGVNLPAYSAASASLPQSSPRCKLVVGTAGRLIPLKGLTYFLQAAREVLAEFSEVCFLIVGAGPERARLEGLARELGIAQNVRFGGFCADMTAAFAQMDIFVLPSIEEAMPMVILEALAAQKAIVATRVGAVPRMIAVEETGLLIPPKDVKALKLSILRLLRDPSLRMRLGKAGEALVRQNYSRETMARKYLQLYKEVLNGPRARYANSRTSRKGAFEVS